MKTVSPLTPLFGSIMLVFLGYLYLLFGDGTSLITMIFVSAAILFFIGLKLLFHKESEFTRLFKNCNLYRGTEVPRQVKKMTKDSTTIYIFTLPTGMSFSDYQKYEDAISEHFGKKVSVEKNSNSIPATFRVILS